MATFSWTPLYEWQQQSGRRVVITEFESGKEQRADKGRLPREWVLGFRDTWGVISQIQAFFEARKGPFEAFLWTPPGSNAINVRFKEARLEIKRQGSNIAEVQITLREVL